MPRNFRQLKNFSDTDLGVLKNKHVLRYNNTLGGFELIPFDTVLTTASEDRDIDDTFVDVLEELVEVREGANLRYDGGIF
tara:strand:- start:235 stop:474 length:240 start_codon:yes stop_codon:yes gene_type:complete